MVGPGRFCGDPFETPMFASFEALAGSTDIPLLLD